ncbi:hypothetical protein AAH678_15795 [Sodalis endosymbiont of Spalangia cameroni]
MTIAARKENDVSWTQLTDNSIDSDSLSGCLKVIFVKERSLLRVLSTEDGLADTGLTEMLV